MWIKVNVDDVVMKCSVFIPLGICFSVFYISIHGQTAHLWFYPKKRKIMKWKQKNSMHIPKKGMKRNGIKDILLHSDMLYIKMFMYAKEYEYQHNLRETIKNSFRFLYYHKCAQL